MTMAHLRGAPCKRKLSLKIFQVLLKNSWQNMSHQNPVPTPDFEPGEAHQELRLLLNMMLMDRLKELETEALKAVETSQDPEALNRWRALQQRRRTLMNS
jgi:hypothetical protein